MKVRFFRPALTLVEVLVATALFMMLSASLCFLLRTALSVRKRITSDQRTLEAIYVKAELIAQEARSIIPFRKVDSGFRGEPDTVSFYTLCHASGRQIPDVVRLSYKFKDGSLAKTIRQAVSDDIIEEGIIIRNLKNVRFYYFNPADGVWCDRWDKLDELPQGMKISFIYTDTHGREFNAQKHIFMWRQQGV